MGIDIEPKYGTEKFLKKLERSEKRNYQIMATAGGTCLSRLMDNINTIREHRQAIIDSIKPSRPGFGVVGEASRRAARGGLL